MANARIGSQASWSLNCVESIDTTGKQLTPGDSGKVFMCEANSTAAVLVNLPQLGTDIAGWNAKFILRVASSQDFSILAYGLPIAGAVTGTGDADTVIWKEIADAGSGASPQDGAKFAATDSARGDYMDVFSDGTFWYITAFANDDDHTSHIDTD